MIKCNCPKRHMKKILWFSFWRWGNWTSRRLRDPCAVEMDLGAWFQNLALFSLESRSKGGDCQAICRPGPRVIDCPLRHLRRDREGWGRGGSDVNPVEIVAKDKIQVGRLFLSQTPQWAPDNNVAQQCQRESLRIWRTFLSKYDLSLPLGQRLLSQAWSPWEPSCSHYPSAAPQREVAGFSSPCGSGSWPLLWGWLPSNENIARWTRHKAKQSHNV